MQLFMTLFQSSETALSRALSLLSSSASFSAYARNPSTVVYSSFSSPAINSSVRSMSLAPRMEFTRTMNSTALPERSVLFGYGSGKVRVERGGLLCLYADKTRVKAVDVAARTEGNGVGAAAVLELLAVDKAGVLDAQGYRRTARRGR